MPLLLNGIVVYIHIWSDPVNALVISEIIHSQQDLDIHEVPVTMTFSLLPTKLESFILIIISLELIFSKSISVLSLFLYLFIHI